MESILNHETTEYVDANDQLNATLCDDEGYVFLSERDEEEIHRLCGMLD